MLTRIKTIIKASLLLISVFVLIIVGYSCTTDINWIEESDIVGKWVAE